MVVCLVLWSILFDVILIEHTLLHLLQDEGQSVEAYLFSHCDIAIGRLLHFENIALKQILLDLWETTQLILLQKAKAGKFDKVYRLIRLFAGLF